MSDGPHRTLPMNRLWKKILELAGNKACSMEVIHQKLGYALKKEMSRFVLKTVYGILDETNRGLPFPEDQNSELVQRFDFLREKCRGAVSVEILLDNAIMAAANARGTERMFEEAVKNSQEEILDAHVRSMEEHCFRKPDGKDPFFIRDRLYEIRETADISSLASETVSEVRSETMWKRPPDKTGLDEGPKLLGEPVS